MRRNKQSKPNVLFIVCDDLNNAIANMGRTPCAPAPNLQRLMNSGVRFTNAHNNCPVCAPSRNSFLSGLYPHTTNHCRLWDHWRNIGLLRDAVMMPSHFLANGYHVFGTGKVHHEGMVDESWWTDYGYGPDQGPFPWAGAAEKSMRPDQDWLVQGECVGEYCRRYQGMTKFLRGRQLFFPWENGFGPLEEVPEWKPDPRRGIPGYRGWRCKDGSPFRYLSAADRDLLVDEKSVKWAGGILQRNHEKPFMLAVGFMKPHTPLYVPRRFFDMFPPESLKLPPILEGDVDDCAAELVNHCPYGFLRYRIVMQGGEALWRKWLQAYLACVAFVDEQTGRLLDSLEASPYADNTIVIFTSDNGYHMGEKQYLFKNSLWEESSQVPLIVRAPGIARPGGICAQPVALIDVYPTLVDLCGLPANPHAQTHGWPLEGHSLRPFLENPVEGIWPGPSIALTSSQEMTGVHHSARSDAFRYTLCENGEEELYDHRVDPFEWHNLAGDRKYDKARQDLRCRMTNLLHGPDR